MLEAAILEALANPALRAALIALLKDAGHAIVTEVLPELRVEAMKLIMDIFHRHATDPDFKAKFDVISAQYKAATTQEDKDNAARALSQLQSSG